MILAVRLRKHQAVTDPAQLALFGRRITEARLEAGLTKTELADKLGVELADFEQFEAGEADPSKHFDRLAQLTGKPVAWLRGDGIEAPTVVAPVTADPAPVLAVEPEPEREPEPAPEPEPEAQEIQEEPTMADEPLPADETDEPDMPGSEAEPAAMASAAPAGAAAASPSGDDDFSDDDLTRMLTGLTRQREAIASGRAELDTRAAELDERERMLSERDDHLGTREDAVREKETSIGDQESSRSAALDSEWQEKLRAFEDTNRQYAAAATQLADWAKELRGDAGEAAGEAEAEAEPEAEEPESPPEAPDPDAFPEDDDF
jgi:transcriptional regulator with XRE-family HTH domain